MCLPASGLNKLSSKINSVTVVDKWDDKDLNLETIENGYGYFEYTPVMLKKKKRDLLMQLVNPHFAKKVRVYFDPYARQTMAVGVGGLTVAGGLDKSYFVKVGEAPAYKIEKKNYDDQYPELFKSCPTLVAKIKEDPDWKDFAEHVIEFTECE